MGVVMKKYVFRIFIPLLLLVSAFAVPIYKVGIDISNFLTAVSVLFAILLGFFIATATTNYLNFQANLADEGTALIMLFNLGLLVRPSAKEKIAEAIDQYVIATLDFSLTDYVKNTQKEYNKLVEVIDGLEPEDEAKRRMSALDYIHQVKANMLNAREAITFAAQRVTTGTHWAVIVLLGGILTLFFFDLRDGHFFSNAIVGVLITTLYLILLLLYEVDNNVFLEGQLAYQDVQGVFRAIGKIDYYPAFAIEKHLIKKPEQAYRIGVYKDYPHSTEKTIKTISFGDPSAN